MTLRNTLWRNCWRDRFR